MTTSRTGTARYLRNRRRALLQAQHEGLTHCPGYTDARGVHHSCGIELDYDVPLLDNSAETDHVVSHKQGGGDDVDNLVVICRRCNLRKGDGMRVPVPAASPDDFPVTRDWFATG